MENILEPKFYKLKDNPKLVAFINKTYPPNEQQRYICDYLDVSYSLWSFYMSKFKNITQSWDRYQHSGFKIFKGMVYQMNYDDIQFIYFPEYKDMKLSQKEKYFIYFHKAILKMQETYLYRIYSNSLRDIAMNHIRKIMKCTKIKDLKPYLPNSLIEELSENVKRPEYNCQEMGLKFYNPSQNLNHLFTEIDRSHSLEFVTWFQNEIRISDMLDLHSIKIVAFSYVYQYIYFCDTQLCIKCMSRSSNPEKRHAAYFWRNYEIVHCLNSTLSIIHYIQNPFNWCQRCFGIPLFQILKIQDCVDQYGKLDGKCILRRDYYI